MHGTLRAGSLAILLLLLPPVRTPAAAQSPADVGGPSSGLVDEAAVLGLNAAVGALTAGLWREIAGGSFGDGFAGGALGGSVVYAGKRIAAESFPGAGFLGRDVAAAGTSMIRNAADARPLLDSLAVPVGPARLYLSPPDPALPRLEVELYSLYWTAYGLAESRLSLDVGESLRSGTTVFRSDRSLLGDDDRRVFGGAAGSVIFLSPLGPEHEVKTLAHERTHVLQYDFLLGAWFRPLEERLAGALPERGFSDRLDYQLVAPALRLTGHLIGLDEALDAPIQAEAEFFERR